MIWVLHPLRIFDYTPKKLSKNKKSGAIVHAFLLFLFKWFSCQPINNFFTTKERIHEILNKEKMVHAYSNNGFPIFKALENTCFNFFVQKIGKIVKNSENIF